MSLLMFQGKIKPEVSANDVEAAVKRMFSAIEQARPESIRYASLRQQDGNYVALLQVDDGIENPLPKIPEYREFQERLKSWVAEPPPAEPLTVVGSYRLFERQPVGGRS
jgi:hypothetical protein